MAGTSEAKRLSLSYRGFRHIPGWHISSGPFLFASSSIVFGVDHLLYLRFVASLVPSWISWHLFWAYLTAFAFIAARV
jgi:hypothetical protein